MRIKRLVKWERLNVNSKETHRLKTNTNRCLLLQEIIRETEDEGTSNEDELPIAWEQTLIRSSMSLDSKQGESENTNEADSEDCSIDSMTLETLNQMLQNTIKNDRSEIKIINHWSSEITMTLLFKE